MFCYKIHRSGGKVLLAACDSEIAGKKFEDGRLVLDIKEDFYCGEKTGNEILELFPKADTHEKQGFSAAPETEFPCIINIAGKGIVSLAIKNGWVSESCIIKIRKVPHAQIFVL